MKLSRNDIRDLIGTGAKWLLCITAFRLLTLIFYTMIFSSEMNIIIDYDKNTALARAIVVGTSFVSWIIFLLVYTVFYVRSHGDERRRVLSASREPGFSALRFCLGYLPTMIVRTALLAVTQLIFCGFFAIYGFKYTVSTGSTIFERFHIADAGWYLVTGNAFLGLLLNIVFAALSLYAMHILMVKVFAASAKE